MAAHTDSKWGAPFPASAVSDARVLVAESGVVPREILADVQVVVAGPTVEFAPSVAFPPTRLQLPGARSAAHRNALMYRLDRLIAQGTQKFPESVIDGVPLLEAMRFGWFEALEPWSHREWVLAGLNNAGARHVAWNRAAERAPLQKFKDAGYAVRAALPPNWGDGAVPHPTARRLPSFQGGRPMITFVEHHPHSALLAADLARGVRDEGSCDVLLVATRSSVARALAAVWPQVITLGDGFSRARVPSFLAEQARLVTLVRRLERWAHAQHGSGWPTELGALTLAQLQDALRTTRLFAAIADVARPSVVVSTGNGTFARAPMLVGHHRGATSVLLQHGLLSPEAYETRTVANHLLLWGPRDRDKWRGGGYQGDVYVTGSPRFDSVRGTKPALPAPGTPLVVAYLPSRTGGSYVSVDAGRTLLERVLQAIQLVPPIELLIKVHPGDRSGIFDRLNVPGVTVVTQGDSLEFMARSHVCVVSTSASGTEACALGLPLVLLDAPGVQLPPEYLEYGAGHVATDTDELARALTALRAPGPLHDRLAQGRRALLAAMFDGLVPGALERSVSALIAWANDAHAKRTR